MQRDKIKNEAMKLVEDNPAEFGALEKYFVNPAKKAGGAILDTTLRALNIGVAGGAVGIIKGVKNAITGEGTPLDGYLESVKKNMGFGDLLAESGVPSGDPFKILPPLPTATMPMMVSDILHGHLPDPRFKDFGITMTPRGAVGMVLDIALDPATYLSFGMKPIASNALKAGGAVDRSIVRFAGKGLLTDKEFMNGMKVLKSTPAGKKTLELMDRFAMTEMGKNMKGTKDFLKGLGDKLADAFIPGHGENKTVHELGLKVEKEIFDAKDGIVQKFSKLFKPFSSQEKLEYVNKMLEVGKKEMKFRELKKSTQQALGGLEEVVKKAGFGGADDARKVIQEIPSKLQSSSLISLARKYKGKVTPEVLQILRTRKDWEIVLKEKGFTSRAITLFKNHKNRVRELLNKGDVSQAVVRNFEDKIVENVSKLSNQTIKKLKSLDFDTTKTFGSVTFKNPAMNAVNEEVQKFFKDVSRRLGVPDEVLYTNYFPSIFRSVKEESVKKVSQRFTRLKQSGAFLKKEFIENENLIKDPIEALTRRAHELITMERINNGFVQKIIKSYGKQYDDVMKASVDGMFPTDVQKLFKGTKFDFAQIGIDAPKELFLPNQIVKSIEKLAQKNKIPTNSLLRIYDKVTTNWKSSITSWFPEFHARNVRSNVMLRYMNEGIKAGIPNDWITSGKMILHDAGRFDAKLGLEMIELGKGSGKKVSLSKVLKWAKKDGIVHSGSGVYRDALEQVISRPGSKFEDAISNVLSLGVKADNQFTHEAVEIGKTLESHGRLSSYLRSLKDGFSRSQAQLIVNQGLFDYGALTPFEKNVMRRAFPFYVFTRKSAGLMGRSLLTNPGRQANMLKAFKDVRDDALSSLSPEQLEAFNDVKDDFANKGFSIPVGMNPKGEIIWFTGLGMPQEDIFDIVSDPIQNISFRLNPLLKAGVKGSGALQLLNGNKAFMLKEYYNFDEAKFLLNQLPDKGKFSKESFKEIVNSKYFQAHPLTKLLKLRMIDRDIYDGGRVAGKESVLQADATAVETLRSLATARVATNLRALGNSNIEEQDFWLKFSTGISLLKQSTERTVRRDLKEIKENTGKVLSEAGRGGSMSILFSKDPEARKLTRQINRTQKRI